MRPIRNAALIAHQAQHKISTRHRSLGTPVRRNAIGALDDRRQQRRLSHGQRLGGLSKIKTRGFPNAMNSRRPSLSQINLVQIRLEDLRLAVTRLHN